LFISHNITRVFSLKNKNVIKKLNYICNCNRIGFWPNLLIYRFMTSAHIGSRWLSGNTLISDASVSCSTPRRGTLELEQAAILSRSVKCVVISKQWVTAVESYDGKCRRCDVPSFPGPAGSRLRSRLLKQEMSICSIIWRIDEDPLFFIQYTL